MTTSSTGTGTPSSEPCDESDDEKARGRMPFFEWVEHYLSRMERGILNDEGIYVSGT